MQIWSQVDPKAEHDMASSPYASMYNNPIRYNDPLGDCPNCILGGIGAAIGGVGNLIYQGVTGNINSVGDGFAAFGIGAAAGFVTGFTGGAASGAFGTATLGASIGSGAVAGAAGGSAGGLIQGTGNAMYFGNQNFGDAFSGAGLQGALYGGIGGAVTGAIGGALTYKSPANTTGPPNKAAEVYDEFIDTYSNRSVSMGNTIKDGSVKAVSQAQNSGSAFAATVDDPLTVTASRLPFARSSINGLSVTNPAGSNLSISIPNNYVAIATRNGKGIIYGPQGVSTNNMANAIRVHLNPTSYAPNGYAVFYNSYGQAFNPNTGRTLSKALWHFLIP